MTPKYISWQIRRRAGPVPLPVNVGAQMRSHGLLSNECRKGEAAASTLESIRWEQRGRLRLILDLKARELTDSRGVDCVVEIGGPGTIAMSLKALDVGGHVSLIGSSLSQSGAGLDPLLLTGRGITLGSISVGSRADFEAMNRAIAMHRLHPL